MKQNKNFIESFSKMYNELMNNEPATRFAVSHHSLEIYQRMIITEYTNGKETSKIDAPCVFQIGHYCNFMHTEMMNEWSIFTSEKEATQFADKLREERNKKEALEELTQQAEDLNIL